MKQISMGVAAVALFSGVVAAAFGDRVNIGIFSETGLQGWQSKSFEGETTYTLVKEADRTVVKANSVSSASGFAKKVRVDLSKTPFVNWSWKVDNRIASVDERTKDGDDYPARLYLIKSGGVFVWRTESLNYVWSSNQQAGEIWPNPFQPKNSMMFAVRGADDEIDTWVVEKRNVLKDFKAAFGKDITIIDAVAIMTDTDNSKQRASASYGDIFFTAE